MKTKTILTTFLFTCVSAAFSQNKSYYISPSGNDSNDGSSPATAWKTIAKVNSQEFLPGDKILFESGKTWHGQLFPKGSGVPNNPIVLSSYGGDARPVIDIDEAEGAGVRLTDQSHWIISHMEFTSGSQPTLGIGRQGVVAISDKADQTDLKIIDCYMHDIWGQLGGDTEYCGYNSCAVLVKANNRWRPVGMNAYTTRWTDVEVAGNNIERMDKCGIIILECKTGMHVHHNTIFDTGGDAIFCGGCDHAKIEYNVAKRTCLRSGYPDLVGGKKWWPHTAAIWISDAVGTIMQYNAVYDTHRQPGNGDGEAFDFDFNCIRCIAQYNYSENNGGFLLIMSRTFENIARYNVSVNDQTHLVQMQCANVERNLIYNNVFYIDYGTVDLDFFCGNDNEVEKSTIGACFFNNIFYAIGQSFFRTVYTAGEVIGRSFDETTKVAQGEQGKLFYHNCYYGPWKNGLPNDPEAIVTDPMLIAPGTVSKGGLDRSTLTAYMLKEHSPLINAGIRPTQLGSVDFFGNSLVDHHPDVGVYEYIDSLAMPITQTKSTAENNYQEGSDWALAKFLFPRHIVAHDGMNEIAISLQMALPKSVSGTISWLPQTGKGSKINIAKQKSRTDYVLKVNGTLQQLLNAKVKVELYEKDKKESFLIPFVATKR